ncbi:MAG: hypothetical protein LUD02_04280 [Tannerellaceae bacterium]|nr:hypothetical protein [Tannerellaceae bacterium]MCD8263464.1 hypothetical protein [Tannerellaceae bacterium]
MIEQLTLNYIAEDSIDLNNSPDKQAGQVYQNYPLGKYPLVGTNITTPTFCYPIDAGANLLFLLSDVQPGDILTLYLNFTSSIHTHTDQAQPLVVWYWGNGY